MIERYCLSYEDLEREQIYLVAHGYRYTHATPKGFVFRKGSFAVHLICQFWEV